MASRPPSEEELIERAQRGDGAAFGQLVRMHEEIAFRTAWIVTRDAAEAEDAAQEAFVKAYRALPRFRAGAPFRPWVLRIVANEARNRRRSAGRRQALALRAGWAVPSGDAAPSPEGSVVAADEARRLLELLDTLPEDQRAVLACRFLLDLSEDETAAALGIRRGTVKSRTSRALDRLRDAMT